MITTAVFNTKPYDRDQLKRSSAHSDIEWRFLECRLTKDTAAIARGAQAVCVFGQ
jgi:D-lactate dehydrogenase